MAVRFDLSTVRWVAELRHLLGLGIECRDGVTGLPATGEIVAELERIGNFAVKGIRLMPHGSARHALPWDGRVRRLMELALDRNQVPAWVVRLHGDPGAPSAGWDARRDRRRYLPRRLRLVPLMNSAEPVTGLGNRRRVALWPGAAYPVPGEVTAVRGRVMHDGSTPMPWARVLATVPGNQETLEAATVIGRGGCDDRGEFLMVIGRGAVAGAALPAAAAVRLWAFAPPAIPVADPRDPLAVLPIEDADTAGDSPVLRGEVVPASYTRSRSRALTLPLAAVATGPAATLTLP